MAPNQPLRVGDIIRSKTNGENFRVLKCDQPTPKNIIGVDDTSLTPQHSRAVVIKCQNISTGEMVWFREPVDSMGSLASDAGFEMISPAEAGATAYRTSPGDQFRVPGYEAYAIESTEDARWNNFKSATREWMADRGYTKERIEKELSELEALKKRLGVQGLHDVYIDYKRAGSPAGGSVYTELLEDASRGSYINRTNVEPLVKFGDLLAQEGNVKRVVRPGAESVFDTADRIIFAARNSGFDTSRIPANEDVLGALKEANTILSNDRQGYINQHVTPLERAIKLTSQDGRTQLRELLINHHRDPESQKAIKSVLYQLGALKRRVRQSGGSDFGQIDAIIKALMSFSVGEKELNRSEVETILDIIEINRSKIAGSFEAMKIDAAKTVQSYYQTPMDVIDEAVQTVQNKIAPLDTESMGKSSEWLEREAAAERENLARLEYEHQMVFDRTFRQTGSYPKATLTTVNTIRGDLASQGRGWGQFGYRDYTEIIEGEPHQVNIRERDLQINDLIARMDAMGRRPGEPFARIIHGGVVRNVMDMDEKFLYLELPKSGINPNDIIVMTKTTTSQELYDNTSVAWESMQKDATFSLRTAMENFRASVAEGVSQEVIDIPNLRVGGKALTIDEALEAAGLQANETAESFVDEVMGKLTTRGRDLLKQAGEGEVDFLQVWLAAKVEMQKMVGGAREIENGLVLRDMVAKRVADSLTMGVRPQEEQLDHILSYVTDEGDVFDYTDRITEDVFSIHRGGKRLGAGTKAELIELARVFKTQGNTDEVADAVHYFMGEGKVATEAEAHNLLLQINHLSTELEKIDRKYAQKFKQLESGALASRGVTDRETGFAIVSSYAEAKEALIEEYKQHRRSYATTLDELISRAHPLADLVDEKTSRALDAGVLTASAKASRGERLPFVMGVGGVDYVGVPLGDLDAELSSLMLRGGTVFDSVVERVGGHAVLVDRESGRVFVDAGEGEMQEIDAILFRKSREVRPIGGRVAMGEPTRISIPLEPQHIDHFANNVSQANVDRLLSKVNPRGIIYALPGGETFGSELPIRGTGDSLAKQAKLFDRLYRERNYLALDTEWNRITGEIENIAVRKKGPASPQAGEVLLDMVNTKNMVPDPLPPGVAGPGNIPQRYAGVVDRGSEADVINRFAAAIDGDDRNLVLMTHGTEDIKSILNRAHKLGDEGVTDETIAILEEAKSRNANLLLMSQFVDPGAKSRSLENLVNEYMAMGPGRFKQIHAADPDLEATIALIEHYIAQGIPGGGTFADLIKGTTRQKMDQFYLGTGGAFGRGRLWKFRGFVDSEAAREAVGEFPPDAGAAILASRVDFNGEVSSQVVSFPVAGAHDAANRILSGPSYSSIGDALVDYREYVKDLARRQVRRGMGHVQSGVGGAYLSQLADLRAGNQAVFDHTMRVLSNEGLRKTFLDAAHAERPESLDSANKIFSEVFGGFEAPAGASPEVQASYAQAQGIVRDMPEEIRPYILRWVNAANKHGERGERLWEQRRLTADFWNTEYQIHRPFYESLLKNKELNKPQKALLMQAYHKDILESGVGFSKVISKLPEELVQGIAIGLETMPHKIYTATAQAAAESLESTSIAAARGMVAENAEKAVGLFGRETVDYLTAGGRMPSRIAGAVTQMITATKILPGLQQQEWWGAAVRGAGVDVTAANLAEILPKIAASIPASYLPRLDAETTEVLRGRDPVAIKSAVGHATQVANEMRANMLANGPDIYTFGKFNAERDILTSRYRNLIGMAPEAAMVNPATQISARRLMSTLVDDPEWRKEAIRGGVDPLVEVSPITEVERALGIRHQAGTTAADIQQEIAGVSTTKPVSLGFEGVPAGEIPEGTDIQKILSDFGDTKGLEAAVNQGAFPKVIADKIAAGYGLGRTNDILASLSFEGIKVGTSPLNATTASISRAIGEGVGRGILGQARMVGVYVAGLALIESLRPLNLDRENEGKFHMPEPPLQPGQNLTYRQQPMFSRVNLSISAQGGPDASYEDAVAAIQQAMGAGDTVHQQMNLEDRRQEVGPGMIGALQKQLLSLSPHRNSLGQNGVDIDS